MAIFRPGPVVADIRGSSNGTTFSRNRFGLYIRARVKPVNPATPRQTSARDRLTQCQTRYRDTLTPAQREGWDALAEGTSGSNRFGSPVKWTPQNLYIRLNTIRLLCGETEIDDAPLPPGGCDMPTLTIAGVAASGVQVTAIAPAMIAEDCLEVVASPQLNPTVNFYAGPWAYWLTVNGVQTPPLDIVPAADTDIGDRFHVRARFANAVGRVSPWQTYVIDVAT